MKKILLFAFFLCFHMRVYAAPVISNLDSVQVGEGQSLTIQGSGFGVKQNGSPLVFDNFDKNDISRQDGDIIAGKKCSDFGQWNDSVYNMAPVYTNSGNRIGSELCTYHYLEGGKTKNHAPMWIKFADKNTPVILVSYWTKFQYTQGTDTAWQLKYFRLTDGVNDADPYTFFQDGWWTNRPENSKGLCIFFLQTLNPVWENYSLSKTYSDTTLDYNKIPNEWFHYLLMIKQSSASGVADGQVQVYVNGRNIATEEKMVTYETGEVVKGATFMWYMGNNEGEGTAQVYFDDIYIDNSWQSLWICDGNSWDESTHREVQVPTAWSSDSITLKINQGSFKNDETAYLFVVDQNGVASEKGKPIVFCDCQVEAPGSVSVETF